MSGEVRNTWVSFAITLSAQPISYHNQHSLTQPYCNFLPFPLIFCPNEICLIVAFTFILLTCNNTIRSVLLKARKKTIETRSISSTHKKKNFQFAQSTNKKQIRWQSLMFLFRGWTLLPLNDNCLENSFDRFHRPNKERIQYFRNFLFSVEIPKSLLKYDSFLPPMTSSSFSLNF